MDAQTESNWLILKKLISRQKPDLAKIESGMRLYEDLGFESISMMQLILAIENEFGIQLRGDDLKRDCFRTGEELTGVIMRRKKR